MFTLEKLAYDDNDNVREAALVALQRVVPGDRSLPAFIAALGRDDYQLVRTAALGVKGQTSNKYAVTALADALVRITAQKSDTSRDTRLALMERLREAGASQAPAFEKLLTDFDPRIAEEAAAALRGLTGVERAAAPRPMSRSELVRPKDRPAASDGAGGARHGQVVRHPVRPPGRAAGLRPNPASGSRQSTTTA